MTVYLLVITSKYSVIFKAMSDDICIEIIMWKKSSECLKENRWQFCSTNDQNCPRKRFMAEMIPRWRFSLLGILQKTQNSP